MTGATNERKVSLRIDGRKLQASAGAPLLRVARQAGIDIPTLCDHEDLEPFGGCRLCLVEVIQGGKSSLVTSCLYPAAEGLDVRTRSERVLAARRQVLSLLLARCPSSTEIRRLADEAGADAAALLSDPEADRCILCGLCTRVCEAHATSAIATTGRGTDKEIGAFFDGPPPDCVGCGGCALVCPTGNIASERTSGGFRIWGRDFPAAVARVDRTRCVGCGACEEACPFSVARVALLSSGSLAASIPAEHCRGCGACAGACPAGAIEQDGFEIPALLARVGTGQPAVLACGRSGLASGPQEGVSLLDVPCTGRASVPLLLFAIARGAEGVLVLGRQQSTCRLDGAEDPARARVAQARTAIDLLGLGADRVRFEVPGPGSDGPTRSLASFRGSLAAMGPNPLPPVPPDMVPGEGFDSILDLLHWLMLQDLEERWEPWLAAHGLPAVEPGGVALTGALLPWMAVLADDLLAPARPDHVLRHAVDLLGRLGIQAGIHVACPAGLSDRGRARARSFRRLLTVSEAEAARWRSAGVPAEGLDALLASMAADLQGRADGEPVACDGSTAEPRWLAALGFRPVDVGPDPLPASFDFPPDARRAATARLQLAERLGAGEILVPSPQAWVRLSLLSRDGTWRGARVRPRLLHEIVARPTAGRPSSIAAAQPGEVSP